MVEIKAGPELDRSAAEAIGLQYTSKPVWRNERDEILGTELEGWWDGDKYVAHSLPRYSTDLNAAFEAAEAVGLFDDPGLTGVLIRNKHISGRGPWCIDWDDEGEPGGCTGVYADTAALAICKAVLKLKSRS